jgi:thiol:disulfide interchange protein DsbD
MKRTILFLIAAFAGTVVMAQSNKMVNWSFSSKKVADRTYEVHMTASIGGGFHMYSQNVGGDGPIPTSFTFTKSPLMDVQGSPREKGQMIKKFESAWNHDVNYYENTVDFVQVVKLKSNVKTNLAGKVEFMVCNDHECLPPSTVDIKVNIGG